MNANRERWEKLMKGKSKMATKYDLKKMAEKDRKEDKKMMMKSYNKKGRK